MSHFWYTFRRKEPCASIYIQIYIHKHVHAYTTVHYICTSNREWDANLKVKCTRVYIFTYDNDFQPYCMIDLQKGASFSLFLLVKSEYCEVFVCLVLLNQVEFDVKFGFLHHFILSVVKSFCQFRDLSGPFVFTL